MIEFYSENDFVLTEEKHFRDWIIESIVSEGCEVGELSYVFCSDTYLHNINTEFLQHDTLTDIITFDNSLGKQLFGEIYISTERVQENSVAYDVSFEKELARVMIHGVLHLCGQKDKTEAEAKAMREKENHYLERFHHLSS